MGAIAGWVARAGRAPQEAAIAPALAALAHRGARAESVYGFRTENGHRLVLGEPHCPPDCDLALALDGAPANVKELQARLSARGYRFAEGSPAEVLARAYEQWDKDVVRELRGAFAFALWDARKERLMLARDRFGEKPLYLHERDGALYFASELRALLRFPGIAWQTDPAAARAYLACGYVPGPGTLVRGVRKLAPGGYALWQFGSLREMRYWAPPDRQAAPGRGAEDAPGKFMAHLEEAVKLRLPAGVLLSGGFDSAALVALASRHGRVKTYSAGFADDRASELARAARLARHFGTEHHEIVLAPRDVIARLPQAVASRDAPVSRPADVALYFIACEAARGVPAALTGDGADEVLGGYRRHLAERHNWLFRSMPTLLMLAAPLARSSPRWQGAVASLATLDWPRRYVRWTGACELEKGESGLPGLDADAKASRLRRALYFDQASWLADHVLERADRLAMAARLEPRAPFLDHRLVELVSSLPDELRVRGLKTKWILRQALKPLLPGLAPRKGGFSIPVGAWLRGEMSDFLVAHLRGNGSATRAYYEPRLLDRVLDEHLAGRRNHETLLWTLLNLEIWHRACRSA